MNDIEEVQSQLTTEQNKHKKTALTLRQIQHTKLKDMQRDAKQKDKLITELNTRIQ